MTRSRRTLAGRSVATAAATAALLVLFTGCAVLRLGPLGGVDVSGDYDGYFDVEGELMRFSLQLLESQGSLSGRLASADGLVAHGRGVLSRRNLRLELEYDLECPGVIVLSGEALDGGRRLLGDFRAEDCTGRSQGAFDLRR